MDEYRVNFLTAGDKPEWRPLFDGYAEFYKTPISDEIADRSPGDCACACLPPLPRWRLYRFCG